MENESGQANVALSNSEEWVFMWAGKCMYTAVTTLTEHSPETPVNFLLSLTSCHKLNDIHSRHPAFNKPTAG